MPAAAGLRGAALAGGLATAIAASAAVLPLVSADTGLGTGPILTSDSGGTSGGTPVTGGGTPGRTVTDVPEPGSLMLLAPVLVGFYVTRRWRRQ